MTDMVRFENLKELIIELRGQSILLDSDVADLYGVETKRINEAVKNNPDKFPNGYIMELDKNEWDSLKSKFSTSIKGGKVKLPSAFTEKGCICLPQYLGASGLRVGNRSNAMLPCGDATLGDYTAEAGLPGGGQTLRSRSRGSRK